MEQFGVKGTLNSSNSTSTPPAMGKGELLLDHIIQSPI